MRPGGVGYTGIHGAHLDLATYRSKGLFLLDSLIIMSAHIHVTVNSSSICTRFGESLELVEQEWLVSEINSFLEERSGRAPQAEGMTQAEPPEVRLRRACFRPAGTLFCG
jgi:hypothetical protein